MSSVSLLSLRDVESEREELRDLYREGKVSAAQYERKLRVLAAAELLMGRHHVDDNEQVAQ